MTSEKRAQKVQELMTRHYADLGRASDWSCRVGNLIQPIRSTTQIWVMTRHQYGISALVSQTLFGGETSGGVAKCRCFLWLYPAIQMLVPLHLPLLGFCFFFFFFFCVLYYKFILYITRGAPNKALKKITITPGKCQLYI